MKVKVYLNRIQTNIKADFERAKEYFKKRGVEFTFDFIDSDYKNLSGVEVNMNPQGRRVFLQPYMAQVVPRSELTMFVFNQEEFSANRMPQGLCYEDEKGIFIDIGTHRNNPANLEYIEIIHELMHALVKMAHQKGFPVQDIMDSYYKNFEGSEIEDSNFGQQWKLLKPYLDTLTKPNGWKHFKPSEVVGLDKKLVDMLDKARGIAGIPFVINSGLRTSEKNEGVGGTEGSSHLKGLAVDLRARNSNEHFLITKGLMEAGFTRISRGYPTHIHADIDPLKSQNVLF